LYYHLIPKIYYINIYLTSTLICRRVCIIRLMWSIHMFITAVWLNVVTAIIEHILENDIVFERQINNYSPIIIQGYLSIRYWFKFVIVVHVYNVNFIAKTSATVSTAYTHNNFDIFLAHLCFSS